MLFPGLTERDLIKMHSQEDKIRGEKRVPLNSLVTKAKKELEEIYSGEGRVNPKYAKEVLIALEYAKNHFHYDSGVSMLDDIKDEKPIDFNDYV